MDSETMLSGVAAYDHLKKYGIPVPDYGVAQSAKDAVTVAEKIGFPVVMKVVSPSITHKSDVGGVVVGVDDATSVQNAFNLITEKVSTHVPDAIITGISIEKQMPPGLELLIGGKTDPAFGKVITFGLGGTLVEYLADVAIRILPLNDLDIEHMVKAIHGYPLIHGYRGEPSKDEATLVKIIRAVIDLFSNEPSIIEFDLNPLILYESGACAVDARLIIGKEIATSDMPVIGEAPRILFSPQSIAVVGASSDPNKIGYVIFRNLLAFPGKVFAVNPNRKEILGHVVYPTLSSIPSPVDVAVVAIPAPLVPEIVAEAGRKKIRIIIIISAGFKESGDVGRQLEDVILKIAREGGIRILGPNCLGIMLPHRHINATFDPLSPRPGHLAFISQSGAVIATIVDWSIPEGIGFSAVISIGNQADLSFDEFLTYLETDPETRAIILYIEEVKNGREFIEVVKKVTATKPVVAIKSGSSQRGKIAASSHTGSLTGSYDVYLAAFAQAGIIIADSLRGAFHVAELVSSEGYPHGTTTIVITSAGGFAVLSSDYAERYRVNMIELPPDIVEELDTFLPSAWSHRNPMDLVGDAGADRFARVFDLMIKHQDLWDIAIVIAVPSAILDPNHLAQEIVRFSKNTHKMIVGCMLGGDSMKSGTRLLRDHDIPNFSDLEDAFRAVGMACTYRERCSPK